TPRRGRSAARRTSRGAPSRRGFRARAAARSGAPVPARWPRCPRGGSERRPRLANGPRSRAWWTPLDPGGPEHAVMNHADGRATESGSTGPMPEIDIATAWEAIADEIPDADALIHGDVVRSWADFESRAARVAGHLVAAGLGPDDKVAFYLHNGTEYLEATFGAFKARCVPVNVNYRYLEAELAYLLDNSDAAAVVVSAELVDRLGAVLGQLPGVRTVLVVGATGEHPVPDGSSAPWDLAGGVVDFDSAVAAAEPMARIARSADDLWFLYTGGTTGMPKGVMWPH